MRLNLILYIPVATTFISLAFSWIVFARYRQRRGTYLLWWSAGILIYGIGTFTEGFVSLFGWNEAVFRAWYISGALLGGAPLAQGTVYLLMPRATANRMSMMLVPFILIAAFFVLRTPLDYTLVELHRLSGKIIVWHWVRLFSPFINTYAFIFLVGGAILSAYRYKKNRQTYHKFIGNVYIAIGAMLPGIGGAFTRFGYTEVLYVTEFIGIVFIYAGYRYNVHGKVPEGRTPALAEPAIVQ
jgi:hypothetical protein